MTRTMMRPLAAVATALFTLLLAGGVVAPAHAGTGGNAANTKLCQKGGWQHLYTSAGATFANQDACVSYAAQGGTLSTTPPPPTEQTICTGAGWTFQLAPERGIRWRCQKNGATLAGDLANQLQPLCTAEGGSVAFSTWVETSDPDFVWCR